VIQVWITVNPERLVSVQGLMIQDLITVKTERQGYGKSLKNSDGFRMAFQVRLGYDQSTDFGVIAV